MLEKVCIVFLVAAFLWHTSNATGSEDGESDQKNDSNPPPLNPGAMKPLDYILSFNANFKLPSTFYLGSAKIRLECTTPTKHIILNVKDMIITKDDVIVRKELETVTPDSPQEEVKREYQSIDVVGDGFDKKNERYVIELERKLEIEEIVLVMLNFRKVLLMKNPDTAYVKYSYTRIINGKKIVKWLGLARSGAINARRLYPCLDSPDSKAKFTIQIAHDKNYRSLSNTSVDDDYIVQKTDEWEAERYHQTPLLSPFSVGFLIADFKPKFAIHYRTRKTIRIWADETVIEQMNFARDIVPTIVEYYTENFVEDISASVIDIAALPNYGHVDRWTFGLMTLDESLLAVQDPSNEIRKIEVALQLCDLFCHQYFGPQATMSTFSANWVNMGFAMLFRIPCLQKIFPEKETSIVNIHLIESFIRVLAVEAEIKSRPLMLPDDSINLLTFFDDSMLAETAYLTVRMMGFFLGQNALYEGVKKYVLDENFKVSNLDELWTKFPLGEETSKLLKSDITLKDIMNSWSSKAGPAHIKLTRDTDTNMVTIEQILPTGDNGEATDPRIIPLNFVKKSELVANSNNEVTAKLWLQSEPVKIKLNKNEWIIHDSRLNVLCLTEYDSTSLDLLEKTLLDVDEYDIIPVLTRANYVFDLFTLAEIGNISYSNVFSTMKYLGHENSHLPLMMALHQFNRIRFGLFRTEIFSLFEKYIRRILELQVTGELFLKIAELPQDDSEIFHFKQSVTTASCNYGMEDCIKQSQELFEKWWSTEPSKRDNIIPEVLRQPILCRAIHENSKETWDLLWTLYDKTNPGKSDDILSVLACTMNPEKLTEYLQLSIERDQVALQDSFTIFKSMQFNPMGYPLMKKFVEENFQYLLNVHAKDRSRIHYYFETLFEITYSQKDLTNLELLLQEERFKTALPKLESHLVDSRWKAKKNIAWLDKNRQDFLLYLQKEINSMDSGQKKPRSKPSNLKAESSGGASGGEGLRRRKMAQAAGKTQVF